MLLLKGRCCELDRRIKSLDLRIGGTAHSTQLRWDEDKRGDLVFWATVPLLPVGKDRRDEIRALLSFPDRDTESVDLGTVVLKANIEPEFQARVEPVSKASGPLVAICMATYNPPLDLFERQIESIRQQSHANWVCVVYDDASEDSAFEAMQAVVAGDTRFHVFRGATRLGFYNNFERCLALVPEAADYVALADQDDYWHTDKLESLLGAFDGSATLVYSDMNLVTREGALIAPTFWSSRPNNHTDIASLLLQNCITGAASMFRRSLLNIMLPFPQRVAWPYHDHWIGCVALASGEVRYIGRPLYDYVQHDANVIGHRAFPGRAAHRYGARLSRFLWKVLTSPRSRAKLLSEWQAVYFQETLPTQIFARVLALRVDRDGDKSRAVRMVGRLENSPLTWAWLAFRGLRLIWRTPESLGREYVMLRGAFWLQISRLRRGL